MNQPDEAQQLFATLVAAAEAGDVEARQVLSAGPSPERPPSPAEWGDDALRRAVLRRDQPLVRALLAWGANARVGLWPYREATSAYSLAWDREYREIVADIEAAEEHRRAAFSPPGDSTAAEVAGVRQAILTGDRETAMDQLTRTPALVTAGDVYGVTPLHLAAWMHDATLVAWLLARRADPSARACRAVPARGDEQPVATPRTPLDFAAICAGWAADRCRPRLPFLENAQVEPERFRETAHLLLQAGAELTPRAAVALGDVAAVRRLHCAAQLPNEIHPLRGGLLASAVRVNEREMVTTLLDLGLEPDESVGTDDGCVSAGMPLWFASLCGRHDIAELLLARGASARAVVYACGDPLGQASDQAMADLLLRHGALLSVEQLPDGAAGREAAYEILYGTRPAVSLNVDQPTQVDLAEQMLWATGDVEIVRLCWPHLTRPLDDPWWHYVLISTPEPDKLQFLLEHGISPDLPGSHGETLLHHLAAVELPASQRLDLANRLLAAGASLTVRDSWLASTPLGWACRWGRQELVKLYLERGADAAENAAEPWARPWAWAEKRGHPGVAGQLLAHGIGTQ